MQVGVWLISATKDLNDADISSARLDSLILLEDTTGRDRSYLLAHPEYSLTSAQVRTLNQKIKKRSRHQPLAYIRGKTEFYGRTFIVTPAVLEPRTETEAVITQVLNIAVAFDHAPKILDIGTGSGCLAVTAKLELPKSAVDALDISAEALNVARQNAGLHDAHINFFISDLLDNTQEYYDILLANLPYVPDRYQLNKAAGNEPKVAIFGGPDGLDIYRKLFQQLDESAHRIRSVVTEALPFQQEALAAIAGRHGYTQTATDGLVQVFELSA